MRKPWKLLIVIIVLSLSALWVDWPGIPVNLHVGFVKLNTSIPAASLNINLFGQLITRSFPIIEGLDLAGGSELTLQVDMSKVPSSQYQQALAADTEVIRRRINLFGTGEPTIQSSVSGKNYRILVDLPGVTDVTQAANLVGKTAQLEIRTVINPSKPVTYVNSAPTGITGADFVSASASYSSSSSNSSGGSVGSNPVVNFTLTSDGAKKFDALTKALIGQSLPIFLDQQLVESPTVQSEIANGQGQISGGFATIDAANTLATQINAGALKAPVRIIQQDTISPILGSKPVNRSLVAGALGLLIIALFMIVYYGRFGVVAAVALSIYALLALAIFKIIPITLTLAGITGFILSVGMAVDANILIFERMREELRAGKAKDVAVELGFNRAWTSIRDSNLATIATSIILYFLTSDLVRGFALTLLIGVLVSMFTAIVVTRTLLRVFLK